MASSSDETPGSLFLQEADRLQNPLENPWKVSSTCPVVDPRLPHRHQQWLIKDTPPPTPSALYSISLIRHHLFCLSRRPQLHSSSSTRSLVLFTSLIPL